jgi:hypothetical protein
MLDGIWLAWRRPVLAEVFEPPPLRVSPVDVVQ